MRIILSLAILVLTNTGAVAISELVKVEGNRFVGESGETIIFYGLNTSDPDKLEKAGQWNERYFAEMSSWGANLVRFPVHPRAWRERTSAGYLALLDEGVRLAEKHGLYVIIDWHSIGNLDQGKFQHAIYETTMSETVEFWRTIAERYQGNRTVAFYELYNEPTSSGDRFGELSWERWKNIQLTMIHEIREIDPETVILVAGLDWAYDLSPVRTDPIDAENIGYVSHPYPQKRKAPWEEQW